MGGSPPNRIARRMQNEVKEPPPLRHCRLGPAAGREPARPVQPPPLFALQSFNALISVGSILVLMLGTVRWTAWEWSAWQIGVAFD